MISGVINNIITFINGFSNLYSRVTLCYNAFEVIEIKMWGF